MLCPDPLLSGLRRALGLGRRRDPGGDGPPRNYHARNPLLKALRSRRKTIIFSDDPRDSYYFLANVSVYPVRYNGHVYPTSEHLFQATKFFGTYPRISEKIRTGSKRTRDAFNLARTYQEYVAPEWHKNVIVTMDEVLAAKFAQHEELKWKLIETGNATIILNSPRDAFWGNGPDGKGSNELGKALMRLRTVLQDGEVQSKKRRRRRETPR